MLQGSFYWSWTPKNTMCQAKDSLQFTIHKKQSFLWQPFKNITLPKLYTNTRLRNETYSFRTKITLGLINVVERGEKKTTRKQKQEKTRTLMSINVHLHSRNTCRKHFS